MSGLTERVMDMVAALEHWRPGPQGRRQAVVAFGTWGRWAAVPWDVRAEVLEYVCAADVGADESESSDGEVESSDGEVFLDTDDEGYPQ
jgi:hypothetical protein